MTHDLADFPGTQVLEASHPLCYCPQSPSGGGGRVETAAPHFTEEEFSPSVALVPLWASGQSLIL